MKGEAEVEDRLKGRKGGEGAGKGELRECRWKGVSRKGESEGMNRAGRRWNGSAEMV